MDPSKSFNELSLNYREPVIHGLISLPSHLFFPQLLLLFPTPHAIFLFINFPGSLPSQNQLNAVVVVKLKSLTRCCHSVVPLRCFPIMWDFGLRDSSSFSKVWGFTPTIPSSLAHCGWPGVFSGHWFDLSTLLRQYTTVDHIKWKFPKLSRYGLFFSLEFHICQYYTVSEYFQKAHKLACTQIDLEVNRHVKGLNDGINIVESMYSSTCSLKLSCLFFFTI